MLKVFPSLFATAKSNERKHWRILQPSPPPLRQLDQPSYFLSTSFFFWGGGGGGRKGEKGLLGSPSPVSPEERGRKKKKRKKRPNDRGSRSILWPSLPPPPRPTHELSKRKGRRHALTHTTVPANCGKGGAAVVQA